MILDFSVDPVLAEMNKKDAEKARYKLIYGIKSGSGELPPENDLNKLSQAVYKGRNDIPGYQLLEATPTIGIYKQIASNTIVIAVRGSADLQDWKTNAQLPFNNLVNTSRYKTDKEFVMNAIQKYGQGNDVYITGHSLGGMVAEQLKRDFDQIKSGITFNPAFESQDLFNREESTVKRRYTKEDPLGILGRNIKGAEVEDNRNNLQKAYDNTIGLLNPFQGSYIGRKLKGHKLTEFESRKKGGKVASAISKSVSKSVAKSAKNVGKKAAKDTIKGKESEPLNANNFIDKNVENLKDEFKTIEKRFTKKPLPAKIEKRKPAEYDGLQVAKDTFKGIASAIKGNGNDDGYALHAIIIKKKAFNKNDAELEASKFSDKNGMFMRETKLSYRFRNIPKTKFEPKTYRTKKINKDISLIYGKLK